MELVRHFNPATRPELNQSTVPRLHPRNHQAGDRFGDTGWVAGSVEQFSEDINLVFRANFWIRYRSIEAIFSEEF